MLFEKANGSATSNGFGAGAPYAGCWEALYAPSSYKLFSVSESNPPAYNLFCESAEARKNCQVKHKTVKNTTYESGEHAQLVLEGTIPFLIKAIFGNHVLNVMQRSF